MSENIKTNKDQLNDAIYNEPMFDTNSFNSSSGTRDPLPVVTVTLQGGKKHIAMNVSGIIFLWDSRATDSMINIKHTKYYKLKRRYNKVEYSTFMECTARCMPYK